MKCIEFIEGGFVTSKSADSLASDAVVDEMSSNAVMSQSMVGMLRSSSWDDNTTSTTPPEPAPTSNSNNLDTFSLFYLFKSVILVLKKVTFLLVFFQKVNFCHILMFFFFFKNSHFLSIFGVIKGKFWCFFFKKVKMCQFLVLKMYILGS